MPHEDWPDTRCRPDTLRLGELAIAAGAAGHALSLRFRHYPAPLLAGLWRLYLEQLGDRKVLKVGRPSDLQRLDEKMGQHLLVLVHDPRLYNKAAWAVMLASTRGGYAERPAIFSPIVDEDATEEPGATLVLQGHPDEVENLANYLHTPGDTELYKLREPPETPSALHPTLEAMIMPHLSRYRDQLVVRGLLAGAALLQQPRSARHGALDVLAYSEVHALLHGRAAQAADDAFDPLATAMVRRANTFLKLRASSSPGVGKLTRAEGSDPPYGRAGPAAEACVSRRQLTDLGNTRGELIGKILQHLRRRPDGYADLVRMGLKSPDAAATSWQAEDETALARRLLEWSSKQVRTHFHRLVASQLITATRASSNGPWLYELPEALAAPTSVFRALPSPGEVRRRLLAAPSPARQGKGPDLPHARPASPPPEAGGNSLLK
jgi:hypothetical protein